MIIESAYSLYLIFYENPTKEASDGEEWVLYKEAKSDRDRGIPKSLGEFTRDWENMKVKFKMLIAWTPQTNDRR